MDKKIKPLIRYCFEHGCYNEVKNHHLFCDDCTSERTRKINKIKRKELIGNDIKARERKIRIMEKFKVKINSIITKWGLENNIGEKLLKKLREKIEYERD